MGKLLENLNLTLGAGLVLAIALMAGIHAEILTAEAVLRWLHVFFGITWIGLLYYFNFVQIPVMPTVPAELKPGVSKYIAPKALFYFRWGAAFTVLTGATPGDGQELHRRSAHLPRRLRADRGRHVARTDHGRKRLVRDLAEPAARARAGRSR